MHRAFIRLVSEKMTFYILIMPNGFFSIYYIFGHDLMPDILVYLFKLLLLLLFWLHCATLGFLIPRPGIELMSPALEDTVLTTGPQEKSPKPVLLKWDLINITLVHITRGQHDKSDFLHKMFCV